MTILLVGNASSSHRGGKEWRISSPLETASGVANFGSDGSFLAYSAMPKFAYNNRHDVNVGNCDSAMEEKFERKPMLEQLLNYRKFNDGMDIYQFTAIGQMLLPIVKREGRPYRSYIGKFGAMGERDSFLLMGRGAKNCHFLEYSTKNDPF
jgi:hypothetical protein